MKITLAPFGTASDVLPMIALGRVLHSRGHAVTICAPEEFRSRIYKSGFPMVSSGKTYRKYLECEGDFEDATTALVSVLDEDMATHFVALRDATRDADAVIGSRLQIAGPSLAEQHGIPYLFAIHTPGVGDHDLFPIFGVPYDRAQKRRSKRIKEWDTHVLTSLNRERKFTHLPPVTNLFEHLYRSGHTLFAIDAAFFPVKTSTNRTTTGFWYLEEEIDMDEETIEYLDQGKPPIYIAPFRVKDQKQILGLCSALATDGHRVVLGYGWENIEENELPPGCRFLACLSFVQIFPRLSVIVHAGAADITMQALRARVPQVVVPYTYEQNFWGQKSHSLGMSPAPVLNGDLSKLQQTIEVILADQAFSERLKKIDPVNQNGTEAAADAIERILDAHKKSLVIGH
jgi:sterol 3beta-glucosyltransferase